MRLRLFVIGLVLPLALATVSDRAEAITIFDETFDGYTEFPDEVPDNDEVNLGIPLTSEGASENWFAARFGAPETDFDCDLAVQEHGGSGNNTPVGRFEDQAGLLFSVDTTGLTDVLLSFDWRTFAAPAGDQSVVGYFVGASPFPVVQPTLSSSEHDGDCEDGACELQSVDPGLFTELLRVDVHSTFTSHEYALPSNVGVVWVGVLARRWRERLHEARQRAGDGERDPGAFGGAAAVRGHGRPHRLRPQALVAPAATSGTSRAPSGPARRFLPASRAAAAEAAPGEASAAEPAAARAAARRRGQRLPIVPSDCAEPSTKLRVRNGARERSHVPARRLAVEPVEGIRPGVRRAEHERIGQHALEALRRAAAHPLEPILRPRGPTNSRKPRICSYVARPRAVRRGIAREKRSTRPAVSAMRDGRVHGRVRPERGDAADQPRHARARVAPPHPLGRGREETAVAAHRLVDRLADRGQMRVEAIAQRRDQHGLAAPRTAGRTAAPRADAARRRRAASRAANPDRAGTGSPPPPPPRCAGSRARRDRAASRSRPPDPPARRARRRPRRARGLRAARSAPAAPRCRRGRAPANARARPGRRAPAAGSAAHRTGSRARAPASARCGSARGSRPSAAPPRPRALRAAEAPLRNEGERGHAALARAGLLDRARGSR